ncbi:hypothetical protein DN37_3207 [Vibrio cholerae]|nr:hypothetical protein DN37_3207 [Vibrio cholerae]
MTKSKLTGVHCVELSVGSGNLIVCLASYQLGFDLS